MSHRVIWKEGTFILPQHFQQQERFFLSELRSQLSQVQPYYWGFNELEISESDLAFSQFSLLKCSGIFQDGTTFYAPQSNKLPASIKLEDGLTNAVIYLVLSEYRENTIDVNFKNEEHSSARITPHDIEISDNSNSTNSCSTILVGDINYTLMIGSDKQPIPDGNMVLAIAKVKEVTGGRIILSEDFIPHLTNIHASKRITRFLNELMGMLSARADELSHRATDSGRTTGVAEYSDFLLLQTINRIEPLLIQMFNLPKLHPLEIYNLLVSTAGELSTYMKKDRRPIDYPVYKHDKLAECFTAVCDDIDTSFKVILDQIATQIDLSPPKNNIRAARLSHKALLEGGVLILAVAANISEEKLRTEFPAQIKIGPGEKIFSLIQSALPGISINLLSHVPSELPYRSGHCYFELDKQGMLWPELQRSKGLAIHVSGDFPGLQMELWAINRK